MATLRPTCIVRNERMFLTAARAGTRRWSTANGRIRPGSFNRILAQAAERRLGGFTLGLLVALHRHFVLRLRWPSFLAKAAQSTLEGCHQAMSNEDSASCRTALSLYRMLGEIIDEALAAARAAQEDFALCAWYVGEQEREQHSLYALGEIVSDIEYFLNRAVAANSRLNAGLELLSRVRPVVALDFRAPLDQVASHLSLVADELGERLRALSHLLPFDGESAIANTHCVALPLYRSYCRLVGSPLGTALCKGPA